MKAKIIQDCYEDYLEECDADWAPRDIVVLSKSEWLKTDKAKAFIKLVTERTEKRNARGS